MDIQSIESFFGLNLIEIGAIAATVIVLQISSMISLGTVSRERWYKVTKLKSQLKAGAITEEGIKQLRSDRNLRVFSYAPAIALLVSLHWFKEEVACYSLSLWYCLPLILIGMLILMKFLRAIWGLLRLIFLSSKIS